MRLHFYCDKSIDFQMWRLTGFGFTQAWLIGHDGNRKVGDRVARNLVLTKIIFTTPQGNHKTNSKGQFLKIFYML